MHSGLWSICELSHRCQELGSQVGGDTVLVNLHHYLNKRFVYNSIALHILILQPWSDSFASSASSVPLHLLFLCSIVCYPNCVFGKDSEVVRFGGEESAVVIW